MTELIDAYLEMTYVYVSLKTTCTRFFMDDYLAFFYRLLAKEV